MSKITEVSVEQALAEDTATENNLVNLPRKTMLAGLGLLGLAQEAGEEWYNKLLERGEQAEKDGRKVAEDLAEKPRKRFKKGEEAFNKNVEKALHRLSVPTKSDVTEINNQLNQLNKTLTELQKAA